MEEESTKEKPLILLAKVLRVNKQKKEVLLGHLEPINTDGDTYYRLVVGRDTWTENFAAIVHPIDVVFNDERQLYILHSNKLDIHRLVKN